MKKILSLLAALVMTIPAVSVPKAEAVNFTLKTTLQSESVVLVNLDTDTVVNEKNANAKQFPGPLVNIMTAVVCLENCDDLGKEITIDESVYVDLFDTEYPDDIRTCDILDGDVLTVSDLLYAMMLTSSCEASQTLASVTADGDITKFVGMMNDKAAELGLEDTHFTNPTGLFDENQYTTAHDMAVLTEYALTVPLFEKIATTYEYRPTVPNVESHPASDNWMWTHSNEMMDQSSTHYFNGAKGIKTANLEMGGRSIVALASRDGNNYLAVLLKSPINDPDGDPRYYHLEDADTLFTWAFNHLAYQVILPNTAEVGELPVSLADGNDYVLARPKEDFSMLWYDEIDTALINKSNIKWYKDSLQAPVAKDEPLGEVTLEYNGEILGTVELVAVSNVERSVSKYNMYAAKKFKDSKWFKTALLISILLCTIYILICVYSYMIYKNKKKNPKAVYAVPKMQKKKKPEQKNK